MRELTPYDVAYWDEFYSACKKYRGRTYYTVRTTILQGRWIDGRPINEGFELESSGGLLVDWYAIEEERMSRHFRGEGKDPGEVPLTGAPRVDGFTLWCEVDDEGSVYMWKVERDHGGSLEVHDGAAHRALRSRERTGS